MHPLSGAVPLALVCIGLAFFLQGCGGSATTQTAKASAGDIVAVCVGEGDRYGDFKCNHDPTHRVCATLLDESGQPEKWGSKGDFWEITGQTANKWDAKIRDPPNPGRGWCICMWATAQLIEEVGCDNVHLECASTDVPYILKSYTDRGTDLASAKECLSKKCPAQAAPEQPKHRELLAGSGDP
mmetsp:Transcript_118120/g.376608  ORF Transcript_118120/g.376608 Transcript_118120/m.376608 type:complete len:184 (-) Transcript_118120:259-810(-)